MVDDFVDEEALPAHYIPLQEMLPPNGDRIPLMQQQQQQALPQLQPSPARGRAERDSSPFLMPVQDLSALPLGTNYGWRVED